MVNQDKGQDHGPAPGSSGSSRQRLVISKSDIAAVITAMYDLNMEIFAPTLLPADPAIGGKDVLLFREANDPEEVLRNLGPGSGNTVKSVREIFFPQTETLFKYKIKKGETTVYAPELGKATEVTEASGSPIERIVFGVRPCDAGAMAILDKVFTWDFDDQFWLAARERTLLIGLGCNTPPSANCFCASLEAASGLGPFSTKGLDMLLVDLGEEYVLEVITERAERFLERLGNGPRALLRESTEEDAEKLEQVKKEALRHFIRSVDVEGLPENIATLFEDPYWAEVANRCIGCGTCTHVCPTCHCFDIQDVFKGSAGVGERERIWDSCMYSEYSLHGSGHNPRPARKFRIRNRVLHKYSYYPERFGEIACVGCGRCVDLCPVNIDIIEMLGELRKRLEVLEGAPSEAESAEEVEA